MSEAESDAESELSELINHPPPPPPDLPSRDHVDDRINDLLRTIYTTCAQESSISIQQTQCIFFFYYSYRGAPKHLCRVCWHKPKGYTHDKRRTSTSTPAFISSTASPPVSVILCKVHVHESCPQPPCKTRKYILCSPVPLACALAVLLAAIRKCNNAVVIYTDEHRVQVWS